MRAVVQRVSSARVDVEGATRGAIERGFLVLLGITHDDTEATAQRCATKVCGLRVFEDDDGRMNLGLADVGGAVLCISQFTLYGDVRRGRRPSFETAARPEAAEPMYEAFCDAVRAQGIECRQGMFGAHMEVSLVNEGPVTLIVDSADLEAPRR